MYSLNSYFSKLLTNISPSPERIKMAQGLHNDLRDQLQGSKIIKTRSPHSRLIGSHAASTATNDLKDIDFVLFLALDEDEGQLKPREAIKLTKVAIEELSTISDYKISSIDVSENRRSVRVFFKDENFYLDVVPAYYETETTDPLLVPDKSENKLIKSQPVGFLDALDELNSKYDKRVKQLIRFVKHLVSEKMIYMRPKSYWLTAMVYREFSDGNIDTSKSIAENVHELLTAIYYRYRILTESETDATPNLPDPMLGHNVSPNWDRNSFITFMNHLKTAVEKSQKALEENDKDKAIALWQQIFGDSFPSSLDDETIENLAMAGLPGASFVSSAGTFGATDSNIPVPSTQFYGFKQKSKGEGLKLKATQQNEMFHLWLRDAKGVEEFYSSPDLKVNRMKPPSVLKLDRFTDLIELFPQFQVYVWDDETIWEGWLRPDAYSSQYRVRIICRPKMTPAVFVVDPALVSDAPHRHLNGSLCLFKDRDNPWQETDGIGTRLVPLICSWLYYYEKWCDTGIWLGPEATHDN